jgi:hypothetical protein
MGETVQADRPLEQCDECGAALLKLQITKICQKCLDKRYIRILREQEREAWVEKPPADLAISHARGLAHLVLAVDAGWTYCGQKATEPKKRRHRARLDGLPDDVCTDCRDAFNYIRKTAA